MHEARKQGLIRIGIGLGLVALPMVWIFVAAATGQTSAMFVGTPVLLGWIVAGFGLGDVLFAGKLRLVVMLLALLVGIGGLALTFGTIHQLGYRFSR
jgi:hypothetical protein